jgi:hypothetical protein
LDKIAKHLIEEKNHKQKQVQGIMKKKKEEEEARKVAEEQKKIHDE